MVKNIGFMLIKLVNCFERKKIMDILVLVLRTHGEVFVFKYRLGREAELIETLIEYAENPCLSFDYYDADYICALLRDGLLEEAERILTEN